MKRGICKKWNDIFDFLVLNLLEYKGVGSGVLCVLKVYFYIDFINDIEVELVWVVIYCMVKLEV